MDKEKDRKKKNKKKECALEVETSKQVSTKN
jgi:hypothetical protein